MTTQGAFAENATPIEAGLSFTIGKRQREQGGFPGADIILEQLKAGIDRSLVRLRPSRHVPAREPTEVQHDAEVTFLPFVPHRYQR